MADPTNDAPPDKSQSAAQGDAQLFYERLEQAGQLVNVNSEADIATVPKGVTHVRYPDGTVKRIRFYAAPYR
jgi:allantoicase